MNIQGSVFLIKKLKIKNPEFQHEEKNILKTTIVELIMQTIKKN